MSKGIHHVPAPSGGGPTRPPRAQSNAIAAGGAPPAPHGPGVRHVGRAPSATRAAAPPHASQRAPVQNNQSAGRIARPQAAPPPPRAHVAAPAAGAEPAIPNLPRGPANEAPTAAQEIDAAADRGKAIAVFYGDAARKLRARAGRPGLSAEDVADYLARADWNDARAKVMAEGGFMPRELRTPDESAAGTDFFRKRVTELLDAIADLDGPEVGMFAGAVAAAGSDRATQITHTASLFNSLRGGLERMAQLLGATRGAASPEQGEAPWTFADPTPATLAKAATIVGRTGDEPAAPDDNTDASPQPTVKHVGKLDPATGKLVALDPNAPPPAAVPAPSSSNGAAAPAAMAPAEPPEPTP